MKFKSGDVVRILAKHAPSIALELTEEGQKTNQPIYLRVDQEFYVVGEAPKKIYEQFGNECPIVTLTQEHTRQCMHIHEIYIELVPKNG